MEYTHVFKHLYIIRHRRCRRCRLCKPAPSRIIIKKGNLKKWKKQTLSRMSLFFFISFLRENRFLLFPWAVCQIRFWFERRKSVAGSWKSDTFNICMHLHELFYDWRFLTANDAMTNSIEANLIAIQMQFQFFIFVSCTRLAVFVLDFDVCTRVALPKLQFCRCVSGDCIEWDETKFSEGETERQIQ